MKKSALLVIGATALTLCLSAQADSKQKNNSSGYDNSDQSSSQQKQSGKQQQNKNQHQNQKTNQNQQKNKNNHQDGDNHKKKNNNDDDDGGKNKNKNKKHNYQQDYQRDYSDIHRSFEQYKGKHGGYQSLPPGISKNLQRGKPMPPGIAKKFDPDMASQLPHYPGYEWQRAGTDAVLVNTTNQVVQEVMRGVLE